MNPVIAMITGGFLCVALILDYGISGLWWSAGLVAGAVLVNYTYLQSLVNKPFASTGSFIHAFSANAWAMLLAFCIGYLPLLIISYLEYRRKTFDKRTTQLLAAFLVVNLLIIFALDLGYLYASLTSMFAFAVLCAPYWQRFRFTWNTEQIIRGTILCATVASTLLIVATYSYYHIALDEREIHASQWLRQNTPTNAIVLTYFDSLQNRAIKVYPAMVGERSVFIADLIGIQSYGDSYQKQEAEYKAVFEQQNTDLLCSLPARGITYLYLPPSAPEMPWLQNASCARQVYSAESVRIFALS